MSEIKLKRKTILFKLQDGLMDSYIVNVFNKNKKFLFDIIYYEKPCIEDIKYDIIKTIGGSNRS